MRLVALLVLFLAVWTAHGYLDARHGDDREQHQWSQIHYGELDCDPRLGCGYN